MSNRAKRNTRIVTLVFSLLLTLFVPLLHHAEELKSDIGLYRGYSKPLYTEWSRVSEYVTVSDGTKLALDLFRPARDKVAVDDRLPVIWTQHRYGRAFVRDGKLVTELDKEGWLQTMLQYGYVVGVLDARGSGASYGSWPGPFSSGSPGRLRRN